VDRADDQDVRAAGGGYDLAVSSHHGPHEGAEQFGDRLARGDPSADCVDDEQVVHAHGQP
jgi:hypothetical protein